MNKIYSVKVAFAMACLFLAAACSDNFKQVAQPSGKTIATLATENTDLTILVAALTKTGLANTFANNNSGSFTVFAPTDDAFVAYFNALTDAQLPPGAVAAGTFNETTALAAVNLLASSYTPAKTTAITITSVSNILLYHAVTSEIPSSKVVGAQGFVTLSGTARLSVSKVGSNVVLNANRSVQNSAGNGAQSVTLDVDASNGVIHTIDRVLIPVANANIWIASLLNFGVNYGVSPPAVTVYGTVLKRVPPVAPSTIPGAINLTDATALAPVDAVGTNYNLLSMAIARAELATVIIPIATPFPDYTVFAPTDDAMRTFLGGAADEAAARTAINNLSITELANLIKYHVVPGRFVSLDLTNGPIITALTGKTFTVSGTTITDGKQGTSVITSVNNLTNAGVLHQIGKVLESN